MIGGEKTIEKHLKGHQSMTSCLSDVSIFFKRIRQNLSGLHSTYVDVTLPAKNLNYSQLTKLTEAEFIRNLRE